MSRLMPFLFALAAITLGCNNDDDLDFDFDPNLMHFDGTNANAPIVPTGSNEFAAAFSSEITALYTGKKIGGVQINIYDIPEAVELVIYNNPNNSSDPGIPLVDADITDLLTAGGWNTITIDPPVDIPTGDLWISVRSTHNAQLQVVGCDAGPRRDGGDWLFESTDNQWRTFRSRSGDNINWNIRAQIVD